MSGYCQIGDAYKLQNLQNTRNNHNTHNIDADDIDLDKLARQVNEQKKQNSRDIYHTHRTNPQHEYEHNQNHNQNNNQNNNQTHAKGIDAFRKLKTYDKGTEPRPMTGFFSAQGEYSSAADLDNNHAHNLYDPTGSGLSISDVKLIVKKKDRKTNPVLRKNKYDTEAEISDRLILSDSQSELSDISDISDVSNLSDISDISLSSVPGYSYGLNPKPKQKTKTITLEDIYREVKSNNKNAKPDKAKSNKAMAKLKSNKADKWEAIRPKTRCIDHDLQSIDSLESLGSGISLLDHLKDCGRCKARVIELIRKSRADNNRIDKNTDRLAENFKHDPIDDGFDQIKENTQAAQPDKTEHDNVEHHTLEIKEILTVCLIGFVVIFILDMAINYRN